MKLGSGDLLVVNDSKIRFRTKVDIIRPTVHGKLLDFTYTNLVNSLGMINSEYTIAVKASNAAKLNVMLVMSYVPEGSRGEYFKAFTNESRSPNDKNVYILFEKYVHIDAINNHFDLDTVDYASLNDRDLLLLLAERSIEQKKQTELLVEETKGIRRSIEKIVIRVLFAMKRVLAMFWADKQESGRATKENPTNPENSDIALRYNKRIDVLGIDELKVQRTKINTQRVSKK